MSGFRLHGAPYLGDISWTNLGVDIPSHSFCRFLLFPFLCSFRLPEPATSTVISLNEKRIFYQGGEVLRYFVIYLVELLKKVITPWKPVIPQDFWCNPVEIDAVRAEL